MKSNCEPSPAVRLSAACVRGSSIVFSESKGVLMDLMNDEGRNSVLAYLGKLETDADLTVPG